MKVDAKLQLPSGDRLADVGARAAELERAGFDGIWTSEAAHDPFLPVALAADATSTAELGTGIAVAFARSPMTVAYVANDLQLLSSGRFVLGLGSQVRPHVERRFAMPWGSPAARMRDFVLALRAIWSSWSTGERLDHQGEFYSHTLMTPYFSPGRNPFGPPPVHLAAVGERMTEVAGEVADGLLLHALTTRRYLTERTLPALQRGAARARRGRAELELSYPCLIATGGNELELATAVTAVREQIAFYASTPAYAGVLELHGWADLGTELTALSVSKRPGRWREMGAHIDDSVLDAFAIVAEPDDVAAAVRHRFDGLVDRLSFYAPYDLDPAIWQAPLEQLRSAPRAVIGSGA
jgi:probable F420-dependent oxidoreductase